MLGFPRGSSTEGMTDFQFKAVIRMVMTIIKDSDSKEEILKKPEALLNKVSKATSRRTFVPTLHHVLPRKSREDVIIIGEKKMGRPTDNPRTEKIGFRLSKQEIKDIEKCAAAMGTQRVNAVTEGIRLLKKELGLD